MELIYGTTNPAKLESMKTVMAALHLKLVGLHQLNKPIPTIDESGFSPLENAIFKANALYKVFKRPLFACDSGLFFDNVDDSLQPGTHVRRVGGSVLTDEEMICHYASFAKEHGNGLIGRYKNAICFIWNEHSSFTSMDESLWTQPFLLVPEAHEKRVPGFPLDSLSVDIHTGLYFYDLPDPSLIRTTDEGFKRFFTECFRGL